MPSQPVLLDGQRVCAHTFTWWRNRNLCIWSLGVLGLILILCILLDNIMNSLWYHEIWTYFWHVGLKLSLCVLFTWFPCKNSSLGHNNIRFIPLIQICHMTPSPVALGVSSALSFPIPLCLCAMTWWMLTALSEMIWKGIKKICGICWWKGRYITDF